MVTLREFFLASRPNRRGLESRLFARLTAAWRLSRLQIAGAAVAIALATAAIYAWNLKDIAATEQQNAQALTSNLSSILATYTEANLADIERAFDRVDNLLDVTRPVRNTYDALQRIQEGIPILAAIRWTDAAGNRIGSSLEPDPPPLSLADHPAFLAQRAGSGSPIQIGRSPRSEIDGAAAIVLSRRRHDIDGRFAGVVYGTLAPAFFRNALSKVSIQSGISVAFVLTDGTRLVAFPNAAGALPPDPALAEMVAQAAAAGQPARGRHFVADDGGGRTASVAALPGTDLMVVATITDERAFQAWHLQLVVFGPLIALVCLLMVGGGLVLARLFERERQRTAIVAAARQQADAASRQKSRFLAMMSHEIRTPMTGIIGFTDLLLAGEPSAERRRQLTYVRDAGRHLMAILNDVLDFSKIEAGALVLERAPFDLADLLESCRAIVWPAAAEKGLTVTIAPLPPGVPRRVRGDAGRLRQILLNLLGNAVKFTRVGGVTVELSRQPDGRLGVAVADTGMGIPESQRHLLFKEFSQASAAHSTRLGGTGLGLTIAKRLVEMMGGEIGVSSRPEAGSTFWFTLVLPAAEADGEAASAPMPASLRSGGDAPARILLVDDVEMNRELGTVILEAAGHRVAVAVDGAEAVDAAAGQPFDLILMDVHMPVMDGLTATARIRALPGRAATVPILAMTAGAMPDEIDRCRQAGMDGQIAKPFNAGALIDAVARHRLRAPSGS